MVLTSEQLASLKMYGEVSVIQEYSARKCAILLGLTDDIEIIEFEELFKFKFSEIHKTFESGKYEAQFLIDYAILQSAKDAKTAGLKELSNIQKQRKIDSFKNSLNEDD